MADNSSNIPYGYCQCGCGQLAPIAIRNRKEYGWIKGKPKNYIMGHNSRREHNPRWKGKHIRIDGYILINYPNHQRSNPSGYVYEHILLAEKALGKSLPIGTQVHHHTKNQLVICQNQSYHKLLHIRQNAYKICGHVNWRKCYICKTYDDPKHLIIYKRNNGYCTSPLHLSCQRRYQRK